MVKEASDLARFILPIKHELKMTMIWIAHDTQMIADYGQTIARAHPEASQLRHHMDLLYIISIWLLPVLIAITFHEAAQ